MAKQIRLSEAKKKTLELDQVLKYIDGRSLPILTEADMADDFEMNIEHFKEEFRKLMNMTFKQYITIKK